MLPVGSRKPAESMGHILPLGLTLYQTRREAHLCSIYPPAQGRDGIFPIPVTGKDPDQALELSQDCGIFMAHPSQTRVGKGDISVVSSATQRGDHRNQPQEEGEGQVGAGRSLL